MRYLVGALALALTISCASGGKLKPFMSFDETPLSDTSSSMAFELDVSDRSVAEKSMAIICECTRLTLERGFKYFYIDERDKAENGRASFRITFYKSPPEGIPVFNPIDLGDPTEGPDPMTSVIDAGGYTEACNMFFQTAKQSGGRVVLPHAADTGSTRVEAGVFDDFESGLPSGKDEFGIPIGFVTFTDGSSAISISTTTTHPPLSDKAAGKNALKLEFDVTGWAGFLHIFENDTVDQWTSYDWTDFNQFSFWLYGRNSGNSLFVHILDNRKPSSTVEDAERYGYDFTDDFSGWKQVIIRFADLRRKEVGNGAPVDGLGLSEVHGWAFGTTNTGGPITYYLDNFELRSTPACGDYPINELPMYGHMQKTADQKRADKRYIEYVTKGGRSREAAAVGAARVGWNMFYRGDRSTAIKRFNQAWLLDPKNQLALWGFAVISIDRAQIEEAIRYYRMAIESGPEDPSLRRDYENALKMLEH